MANLKCNHKKTKMKLTLVGFSKRINPLKWFAMRECCKRCGEVIVPTKSYDGKLTYNQIVEAIRHAKGADNNEY